MAFLEQIKNIWRIRDLRRRVLITVALIAVCRIGAYIPLPGIRAEGLQELEKGLGGVFGLINVFAGGALQKGAIFALGIMPYISASIIFQLLANVIPRFERLRKEGEAGRKKLNQYTRIATVFICLFQGAVLVRALYQGLVPESVSRSFLSSVWFSMSNGFILMCGTMFLMWIGEQIDEHGIGNGISLIIMINILSRLPGQVIALAETIQRQESQQNSVLKILVLLALFVGVIVVIVYITRGERRIPVQQAKHVRGPKVYGGQKHYLPLKVNHAGVMPLIFASALLQFPAMIAGSAVQTLDQDSLWHGFFAFIQNGVNPNNLTVTYVLLYGLMIFFFSYFWTALVFNPQEMSDNLKDYGSFIPGIRPGKRTADYLEGIMNRVTMAGSFFLLMVALMPMLVAHALKIPLGTARLYGGTSILIVVGVALDLMNRINQHLEMRRYSGFAAGAEGRRKSRRRR
ncbi:MAG: preprotein translocase subunit SecY [Candidatus Brocadiia bacterium]